MVELEKLVMLGVRRWVETYANSVVKVTKMSWSWAWFGARVRRVEVGPNLVHLEPTVVDFLMDEVDWDSNVFNTRGDSFGLADVNARLAVLEDRCRTQVFQWKAKKMCHVLKVETASYTR